MATKEARRRQSRAGKAGASLGMSIVETVHLLYQKNTALNFLGNLVRVLRDELELREGKR